MFFKITLFLAVLANIGICLDEWNPPDFCQSYECPRFKTVSKLSDNVEIREYEESKWVAVDMVGKTYKEIIKDSWWKLYNYLDGANTKQEKLELTVPTVEKLNSTIVFTDDEPVGTMYFYLGYKFQKELDAPKPTEEKLRFEKYQKARFAVISYGGYSKQRDKIEHLKKLGSLLKEKKMSYVKEFFFFAGYDSPYKFWKRHNEIWILLK